MPVKQEPVSVNWQTLYCLLPVVWLWAFYRIEKLRLALVILIPLSFVFSTLAGVLLQFGIGGVDTLLNYIILVGIVYVPHAAISIALVRKWSEQWNEKFS